MTYDGAKLRLYINGVEERSANQTGNVRASVGSVFHAANWKASSYWLGQQTDVGLWSRALAPSEIAALADSSNVMLRCGGVPLIQDPRARRGFVGQAGGGGATAGATPWLYAHRRGSRIIGAVA